MIILLLGLIILTIAVFMLYRLTKHEKTLLNITVPHKVLRNNVAEVELKDLSMLWLDQLEQTAQQEITIKADKVEEEPEPATEFAPAEQESVNEPSNNWYERDDFVQFLTGCINENINRCSGSNFTAFSFNGIVYLTPFGLWSYITLYTKAKGLEQKDKHSTMLAVVKNLSKYGLIKASDIQAGNYTAVYLVTASQKDTKLKPKGVYIPLIAEYFNTENKKEGILTFISNIELRKEVSDVE